MSKKRKYIYITVLSVLLFTLFTLCVVTFDKRDSSVQFFNDIPSYQLLLTSTNNPLHIAYEVQAAPLMNVGVVKAYRTDFISTVIIAVDRDQVSDEITGWNCLRNGDYNVYFGYKDKFMHVEFGHTVLSIAAGLDYEDSGISNTIHLLKYLHHNGRLISNNPLTAPVAIIFDYQAAQLVKDGKNVEIIVPSEGTLSFPIGVMNTYTNQLPEVNPRDLLEAGFRLPNGDCDTFVYPDSEYYNNAREAVFTPKSAMQIMKAVVSFHREVLKKRLFSPANSIENMLCYIIFIIIIVWWSGMLFMRISDKSLQHKLFVMSALLIIWMIIRLIKLQLTIGSVDRFFWYLFYIPLIFLPTFIFWIGQILNQNHQNGFPRLLRKAVFSISTVLVLLVLTNDYHQKAFRFDRGLEGNAYDKYYSYGVVYYLVFGWSLFLIVFFVFSAIRNKSESTAKRAVPLLLVLCGSIIYFGCYAIGIPFFRESEFSIVYGVISLLFLEVCFRNRLIPNNIRLSELLHNAPIEMHLLSDAMEIEYKTNCSEELSKVVVEKIRDLRTEKNMPIGLNHPHNESILYGIHRINGGYSIFAKHFDSVFKLRTDLAEQNKKIKTQNSILARTHKIKTEIARLITQQDLFTKIEGVLRERVDRINTILTFLQTKNVSENKEMLQKQLATIKLLVNYCKRRSNIALLEANNEYCQTNSLALWMREAIWEANAAGIDGLVTEAGSAQLNSNRASLLYDCYEHILESSLKYRSAVLLISLSVSENSIILSIAVETIPSVEPSNFRIGQVLYDTLVSIGASYEFCNHDDGLKIQFIIPKGGLYND